MERNTAVNRQELPKGFRAGMRIRFLIAAILFTVLCWIGATLAGAQAAPTAGKNPANDAQGIVPFDAVHWNLADDAEIVPFAGKTAFAGTAYLKYLSFLNGTIEADMWITGQVNFAGFIFRVQSFDEMEWFWLRMHKTNGIATDATQYAPAYRGVFCWQLNPGSLGPANVPKNQWVHMKLEVLNNTASLFIQDMTKPVMTVDHLRLGLKPGSVGLKTFGKGGVYFSNFSYRIDNTSPVVQTKPEVPPPNVLSQWQLSASYPIPTLDALPTAYPARELAGAKQWITPEIDETGLVNITRYHGTRFQGRGVGAVGTPAYAILRTVIEADHDKVIKMNFGYSDAATIFLNQAPLFSGNSAFLSRNKAFGGWINFNDAVFLNLKKGRNELLAVVADDFGGWAFQAKLDGVEGLTVHADPGADGPAVLTVSNRQ